MRKTNPRTVEAKEMLVGITADGKVLAKAAGGPVTEAVAGWLAPEYMLEARDKLAAAAGDEKLAALQVFIQDWSRLRRADLSAGRLELRREELEWQRANSKWQKEKEFQKWIKKPEVREKYFPKNKGVITPETLAKIEKELRLFPDDE